MAKKLIVQGEPGTQVGIGMKDSVIKRLKDSGKVGNMTFAAYVRTLIDNDLKEEGGKG